MKNSEKGEYVNYRSYRVLPQNSNNARYKLFSLVEKPINDR